MKALWISDIHANVRLPLAKVDEGGVSSDRLRDVIDVWGQAVDHCQSEDIRNIFILGDLYDHKHPDGATLFAMSAAISDAASKGITVHILPGNHDAVDRDGRLYTLQFYEALKVPNVKVLGKQVTWLTEDIAIHSVPWLPEEKVKHWIKELREDLDESKTNVLVFHQSVNGAKGEGGWVCDVGLNGTFAEGFDFALSGHYHKPQSHPWGIYLGAPLQFRFSDDDGLDRGFWVTDFAKTIEPYHVPTKHPKFGTDTLELEDGDNVDDLLDIEESSQGLTYLRLIIQGSGEAIQDNLPRLKEIQQQAGAYGLRAIKLDIRPTQEDKRRIEVNPDISFAEMIKRYVAEFSTLSKEGNDRLESIGMEAIERALTPSE